MAIVRILVADDHGLVRRGVRALLKVQQGWEICGEAATGREAVDKSKHLKPDVVVMDLDMPELNGLEATRQILKELPRTEVLILTIHESELLIREVVNAGARGYLLKSDVDTDLITAVKELSQHKTFFTSKAAIITSEPYLQGRAGVGEVTLLSDPLSPREREIIQLLAEGKSNKEVADKLGISFATARTHRNNIMQKLHCHSVSDLIHYAIRNKMIHS